jgi:hypothetical protein
MDHMRRLLLLAVAVAVAVAVPAAFAGGTTQGTIGPGSDTFADPAGDICPFALDISYNFRIHYTDFYDQSGRFVGRNLHATQQNTYSANGKTLVGDWFTYEQIFKFGYDSSGSRYLISNVGTGQAENVSLPGGSVFHSAGRIDYLTFNNDWIIVVNSGLSGNVGGFCAALAP